MVHAHTSAGLVDHVAACMILSALEAIKSSKLDATPIITKGGIRRGLQLSEGNSQYTASLCRRY